MEDYLQTFQRLSADPIGSWSSYFQILDSVRQTERRLESLSAELKSIRADYGGQSSSDVKD